MPPVDVEVFLLRMSGEGIAYRTLGAPLVGAPDELALRLAGVAGPGAVCHSTSWRYADGRLVLTYAALPDPDPAAPAVPLIDVGVLSSGDPLRPGPAGLHEHHVAAHAVRHLAQLAVSDPAVRMATVAEPALWSAVATAAADMPTGTHADLPPHAAWPPEPGGSGKPPSGPLRTGKWLS